MKMIFRVKEGQAEEMELSNSKSVAKSATSEALSRSRTKLRSRNSQAKTGGTRRSTLNMKLIGEQAHQSVDQYLEYVATKEPSFDIKKLTAVQALFNEEEISMDVLRKVSVDQLEFIRTVSRCLSGCIGRSRCLSRCIDWSPSVCRGPATVQGSRK